LSRSTIRIFDQPRFGIEQALCEIDAGLCANLGLPESRSTKFGSAAKRRAAIEGRHNALRNLKTGNFSAAILIREIRCKRKLGLPTPLYLLFCS